MPTLTLLQICEWIIVQKTNIEVVGLKETIRRDKVADIVLPYACIYRKNADGSWEGLLVGRTYGVLGLIRNSIGWQDSDKWFRFKPNFKPVYHKIFFGVDYTDRTYLFQGRVSVVRNKPLCKNYLSLLSGIESLIVAPNFDYVLDAFK